MSAYTLQDFHLLSKGEQSLIAERAQRNAAGGLCFLCKWIIKKIRYEDFPKPSRIIHLLLCCYGDN